MDTNLTTHYLATQTARARLDTQAGRGWLADQAAAIQPRRLRADPLRQWVGAALILAGTRVQGPAIAAVRAAQSAPSIQRA